MAIWRERLADVDDDYLIGLSNKGIVKRAYKDKGEVTARIGSMEEEVTVEVGEETVTVRYPLGESKCTCPSRSMCRHVVQAILTLKESCLAEDHAGAVDGEEAKQSGSREASAMEAGEKPEPSPGGEAKNAEASAGGKKGTPEPSPGGETKNAGQGPDGEAKNPEGSAGGKAKKPGQGPEGEAKNAEGSAGKESKKPASASQETAGKPEETGSPVRQTAVWREITAYPFAKCKSTLGVRQFQTFVNQVAAGIRPQIRSTSVVTVQLPQQGYVVKLLSPLEYATCSCHKKELCVHKAAAILWCQLEAGTLTKGMLTEEMVETQEYDMEGVKAAAVQMKAFLEELFATGLSRTSPDVLDYLERLAIISHNEGLARFEGYFRSLSDSYDRYFARKASFQTEDLMARMTRLYRRVDLLLQAQEPGAVGRLAGAFRADYLPVGNLNLIGIAMEHFENQAGYEGETIYFLEENTKKWYTYTNARPMFYDSRKKRGYMEKAQSPWGLNISFEDMLKVRIRLVGAKCDNRNRLSSSQETKGEITGEQRLGISDVRDWYYRDFDKLFSGQIGKQQKGWLTEQENAGAEEEQESGSESAAGKGVELVFVQPASCAKAEFSQTGQQLTLPLYDSAGRELLVEVTYSKQESGTIRYLERVVEKKLPCFLGKVYLRDGRVRMYPVDVMEIGEEMEASPDGNEDNSETDTRKDHIQQKADFPDIDVTGRKTKYEVMEDLAGETGSLLEDLYQSGFDTVHDSTLKDIRKNAELTGQYGMQYLSELLAGMAEEIEISRHRMEKQPARLTELYVNVSEYLYLARQKAAYDRGKSYYK